MRKNDILKQKAAQKAIEWVESGMTLGVGTGSTVNFFIDELSHIVGRLDTVVSSSEETTERLKAIGITPVELNYTGDIDLYIDGADEANALKQLIKGGGGALTREKVIAGAAKQFVCIVDQSKVVRVLGKFPLPVEVVPMARSFVARKIFAMGYQPVWRENYRTDNGNIILDIHNLLIDEPHKIEHELGIIPGVVTVGLFADRGADTLIVAGDDEVRVLE